MNNQVIHLKPGERANLNFVIVASQTPEGLNAQAQLEKHHLFYEQNYLCHLPAFLNSFHGDDDNITIGQLRDFYKSKNMEEPKTCAEKDCYNYVVKPSSTHCKSHFHNVENLIKTINEQHATIHSLELKNRCLESDVRMWKAEKERAGKPRVCRTLCGSGKHTYRCDNPPIDGEDYCSVHEHKDYM